MLALDHPKARQQTFNICMDEPTDYRKLGDYLISTRGYRTVEIATAYHSTWLDNAKAKFLLGWRLQYDPRVIWYPG
jgi:UDP-glucose 4-epimerase